MKSKLYLGVILLMLFFLVYEKAKAQTPSWLWAKAIGGADGTSASGASIAIDASGNVYTTGSFYGTVDFYPGPGIFNLTTVTGNYDIFISKFNSAGNFVWANQVRGTGANAYNVGNSIALDNSGNVYTAGTFMGTVDFDPGAGTFNLTSAGGFDIFISKSDSAGNFIWAKSIGGTMDEYYGSLSRDASDNIYTSGSFQGTADFDPDTSVGNVFNLTSAGGSDIFISKLDASGNFVWAKAMGGTGDDYATCIAIDVSGNVCSTGGFAGIADFDPGAGVLHLTSGGGSDIFISKLDSSGNFIWAKRMGRTLFESGRSIFLDASGNIYTTGSFLLTVDFDPGPGTYNLTSTPSGGSIITDDIFISKLDSSGNFVWAKKLGGPNYDRGYSIVVDASGNVYTTGNFSDTADFDPGAGTFNLSSLGGGNIFVSKLDSSGAFAWAIPVGGTVSDVAQYITLDATGNLYVTGYFASPSLSFGPINLIHLGSATVWDYDMFIAKLNNTITGIQNADLNIGFSVFPNPSNGKFILSTANSQLNIDHTSVFNMLGEEVYRNTSGSGTRQKEITIDLTAQPGGIYVVRIHAGENFYNRKIVVE